MLILSECEVELVRQRCVHQFGGLALILIGVLESGINHTDGALMAFKVEPLHYRDRVQCMQPEIYHTKLHSQSPPFTIPVAYLQAVLPVQLAALAGSLHW